MKAAGRIAVSAWVPQSAPRPVGLHGAEVAELRRAFPPRTRPDTWPRTHASAEEVLGLLEEPPLRATHKQAQAVRRTGARLLLGWLATLPGDTWQQRWESSEASARYESWYREVLTWAVPFRKPSRSWSDPGLLALVCADVVRPRMDWLLGNPSRHLRPAIAATRDPQGFAQLEAEIPEAQRATNAASTAITHLAQIIVVCGGGIDDIVAGDLLSHPRLGHMSSSRSAPVRMAYSWLHARGQFPAHAPARLAHLTIRAGQTDPAGLVDRYQLQNRAVRDLFVAYLTERQPSVDHTTLRTLSHHLVGLFWADLERHHPEIDDLRLPRDIKDAWKARVSLKTVSRRLPNGTVETAAEPRQAAAGVKQSVRAFYLDIAEWAHDDPATWGRWAAPCPVSEAECTTRHATRLQKARADHRTRERMPVLPALIRTAERRLQQARERLADVDAAAPGSTVTVHGETFTLPKASTWRAGGKPGHVMDANGKRRPLRAEERRAFYAWATIEILRHTGIRCEEMLELTHHSIIRYRLPATGEIVPLLQIAPSKTDKERLLLVSPELADVLSAVVARVRAPGGAIPSIPTYDMHERTWNAPMPVLFQWAVSGEHRPVSVNTIRRSLDETLDAAGLLDASGRPLRFAPHDFRRIFITDAILNGLPPHIAQVIAGHDRIDTTMGYAAVYPADAIEAHRSFIARRRQTRPTHEYRSVTPEEWDEFLGHFARRKLALGQCGRAYGTDCAHEHACVRCPVLVVGPAEKARLEEIRDNLTERIAEAEREGWLGEAEGLAVSLAAAQEKLTQINAQQQRRRAPVYLGIPTLDDSAGRASIDHAESFNSDR